MPHIHELIDFVNIILIVYRNKVLLILHKKLKIWLPVGGHIELDEDPDEALFREVKEECGLEIEVLGSKPDFKAEGVKPLFTPAYLDIHKITDTHKHVGLYYFATAKSDKFIFNKEEHDDIRWFSKDDLDDPQLNLKPDIKFYAKKALEMYGD